VAVFTLIKQYDKIPT